MKIAFVVDEFPVLSETFILDQITGLIDMGHPVEIFSRNRPSGQKTHPDVDKYNLAKRVHYYTSAIPRNKTICRLKSLCLIAAAFLVSPFVMSRVLKGLLARKEGFSYELLYLALPFVLKKFDIVHAHFGPNGIRAADMIMVGVHVKLVTMFHGYGVRLAFEKGAHIYKNLFEKGDLLLANSRYTYDQLISLGAHSDKMIIHPVGLDLAKFSRRNFSCYDNDSKEVTIISVARLVKGKGLEYGIKAFFELKKKYLDRHLTYKIIGEGGLESALRELVKSLSLDKQVLIYGPADQKEVIEQLENAHIFLLPTLSEGLGVVLLEAQAMELPIVASSVGGVPYAILPEESGFLVPAKDVDALAEKLGYLIENPQVWPQMGRAGRKFVENNYDNRILNQKLVVIYQNLLQDAV